MKLARIRSYRRSSRPRFRLTDLLAQSSGGLSLDVDLRAWLDAPPAGRETIEGSVCAMRRFMRRSRPVRDIDLLIADGRD